MGRWRPPPPVSSKYITPEGKQRLEEELEFLWRKKRPEVTRALSAAAAEGDRSENAEYIYRKKQLREIDARVRFIRKRLENMKVVGGVPDDTSRVFFGAWVTVEDDAGDEILYRVVGPDETDFQKEFISMDSPIGKALMGKSLDAEVEVETPQGKKILYIVDIEYKTQNTQE
jgi:transcription elongation factor GreB